MSGQIDDENLAKLYFIKSTQERERNGNKG
jgi:hypothetical protein